MAYRAQPRTSFLPKARSGFQAPGSRALEREAEGVARRVVSAPSTRQASPAEPLVSSGTGAAAGGRTLPDAAQALMEPGFGRSFAHVRVHDDARAASLAAKLGARAFTTGSDIYFGPGEFRPRTSPGQELLAHELAHVVQQAGGANIASGPLAGARLSPVPSGAVQCDFLSSASRGYDMYTGMSDEGGPFARKLMRWRMIGLGADYNTMEGEDWDEFMANRPEIQRAMADRFGPLAVRFAAGRATGNEYMGGWKSFTDSITGVRLNELESMRLTLHGCHRIDIWGSYWLGDVEGVTTVKFGGVRFNWVDRADLHPGTTTEMASGAQVDDREFTGAGFDYDVAIVFSMPSLSTWTVSGGTATHRRGWPPVTGAPAAGFRG